jgi:hypothetical protein
MITRDDTIREYVRAANIADFTRLLRTELDGPRRRMLKALLLEHEALAPGRPPAILTL